MKKFRNIFLILILVVGLSAQITVEKTIPEDIQISDIKEFVINVPERTIDVHLANGKSYRLEKPYFLDFWNNTMTASQRVVVRSFIKELSALAIDVDISKLTGDF